MMITKFVGPVVEALSRTFRMVLSSAAAASCRPGGDVDEPLAGHGEGRELLGHLAPE